MKKPDLSFIKNFLFEKGEKIAAIVCVAAAVVLIGAGVMSGMSAQSAPGSSRPFADVLNGEATRIKSLLANGTKVDPLDATPYDHVYPPQKPSQDPLSPFFWTIEHHQHKRANPIALAALVDPEKKQIQMDYLRGSLAVYEINPEKQWAAVPKAAPAGMVDPKLPKFGPKMPMAAGSLVPITTVEPTRMVVVHATFPLESQLEEFRKALKMMNQAELFLGAPKDAVGQPVGVPNVTPTQVAPGRDLPKFLGLNIRKGVVTPGGQVEWSDLVRYDYQKDKLEVDPALQAMLRSAVFDDPFGGAPPFAFQGLMMPMPKFVGNTAYPKLDLPNTESAWDVMASGAGVGPGVGKFPQQPPVMPGVMPGMGAPGGGVAGKESEVEQKHWNFLVPDLKEKFFDRFFVLDPLGINFDPEDPKDKDGKGPAGIGPRPQPFPGGQGGQGNVNPFAGNSPYSAAMQWQKYPYPQAPVLGPNGQPMANPNPMNQGKPYDAVIRFIDPDVVPGKTYKYTIQVRIANPNFGKKTEVAQAAFADVKELAPAPPVETPEITIPEEYFVYATDQKPVNPKVQGGSDTEAIKMDQVAIQIHRWVDRTSDPFTGQTYKIGDWAIAERLLVKRGDPIGKTIHVEVPIYNAKTGQFGLVAALVSDPNDPTKKQPDNGKFVMPPKGLGKEPGKKGPNVAEKGQLGIPVDFTDGAPPSVLADFDGGKQVYPPAGSGRAGAPVKDEAASNLLILRPDGRLIVRNNRVDSDRDSVESKLRMQRVEEWDKAVAPLRATAAGGVPGGGTTPMPKDNPFLNPKKN